MTENIGTWNVLERDVEFTITVKGDTIQCSKCGFIHTLPNVLGAYKYTFCPKCGERKVVK